MSLQQITASPKTCQELVDLGIKTRSFFWHVNDFVVEKGEKKLKWDTYEVENPKYKKDGVVPAWTMEELLVMIGGDHDKPDLAPMSHTAVKNDPLNKKPYYDYMFGIFGLTSAKTWKRGAQAAAEILSDLLKRGMVNPGVVNDRYDYFFKP